MAGFHAAGSVGLWKSMLGEIGPRPEVQAALRHEASSVLGGDASQWLAKVSAPGWSYQSLPVLQSVVMETLRLHPPVFFAWGKSKREIICPRGDGESVRIPEGQRLVAMLAVNNPWPTTVLCR